MKNPHIPLFVSALALTTLAPQTNLLAQESFDNVEIRVHHVRGTVYYLEGRGGNIGLSVGDDGVIMVDDQFAPLTDRIVNAIQTLSDDEIRFLINTHIHGDHTGGNANFSRMGVEIVARHEVRSRLALGDARDNPRQPAPQEALPVVTFEDNLLLHLNGEEVSAFAVPPAHTDGDTFIHFRGSDILHAGDVFRTTGYPFIDLANGGTLAGTLDALAIAAGLAGPETLIIPGHGEVSTREDVIEFRDMILDVSDRVEELVERGMTYEQVSDTRPTAAYDEELGDPERFLRAVYQELAGEQ